MINFKEYLNEAKLITVYHGDNFNTTKLDPKLMNNGNNQEGVGIYFGTLRSTAESYGKDIVKAEINPKNFVKSRDQIGRYVKLDILAKILEDMWHKDEEEMFYLISDWVEVAEPEDVTSDDILTLAQNMEISEVRNFQVELAETFGVENFVESWNKHLPNIQGTYNNNSEDDVWYAIIDPKIKVTKV